MRLGNFAGRRTAVPLWRFTGRKTGIGKAFIGLFLMSAITSLPEPMVGISAAALVQSADLAVGDIPGSCAFNLVVLTIMEVFSRNQIRCSAAGCRAIA